jgi:AraC-like DNA-binding protein
MEQHLLKASTLRGIDQWFEHKGHDFSIIERKFGIKRALFSDDEALLSGPTVMRLLGKVSEISATPWLGIELAQFQSIEFLGAITLLLEASNNLREGFMGYVKYQKTYNPLVQWSLSQELDEVAFTVSVGNLTASYRRLSVDLSLAHAYSAAKHLSDFNTGLLRVELSVNTIENEALYRKAFKAPIVLAAGRDALVFSLEAMHKPIATSNERVKALVREHVLDAAMEEGDLLSQVKLLICRLLCAGHCSTERVAAIYSCDKRTLQRHLKLEGASYQQLLDEVRFEMVLNYLRDTNISLTQVAMLVGFADPSNFSRAFKKYFNKSPQQWREEHGISGRASLTSRLRLF